MEPSSNVGDSMREWLQSIGQPILDWVPFLKSLGMTAGFIGFSICVLTLLSPWAAWPALLRLRSKWKEAAVAKNDEMIFHIRSQSDGGEE